MHKVTLYAKEKNSVWWFSGAIMEDWEFPTRVILHLTGATEEYEKVFRIFSHPQGQKLTRKGQMSATAHVTRYEIPPGTYICEPQFLDSESLEVRLVLNRKKENELVGF